MFSPTAIADARRDVGLTQEELAREAGVALRTVQRAEHGEHSPDTRTLMRLAAALGVSVEALMGEPGNNQTPTHAGERLRAGADQNGG